MGKKTFDAQKATEKFFSPCGEQVAPLRGAGCAPELSEQTVSMHATKDLDCTPDTPLRGAGCAPELSNQAVSTHASKDLDYTSNTSNTHSTHYTHDTSDTHDTHSTSNTHNTHHTQNSRGYRYNLNLDADLKDFLHETAWEKRMSMTQYINNLIRREMEKDKLKNDK